MKTRKLTLRTTTEIVYRWSDGREEVRYRRPYGSEAADELMSQVDILQARLGKECPYFYRHVPGGTDDSA